MSEAYLLLAADLGSSPHSLAICLNRENFKYQLGFFREDRLNKLLGSFFEKSKKLKFFEGFLNSKAIILRHLHISFSSHV